MVLMLEILRNLRNLMKNNISKQINSEEELSKNLIEDLSQSHEQKMIKSL